VATSAIRPCDYVIIKHIFLIIMQLMDSGTDASFTLYGDVSEEYTDDDVQSGDEQREGREHVPAARSGARVFEKHDRQSSKGQTGASSSGRGRHIHFGDETKGGGDGDSLGDSSSYHSVRGTASHVKPCTTTWPLAARSAEETLPVNFLDTISKCLVQHLSCQKWYPVVPAVSRLKSAKDKVHQVSGVLHVLVDELRKTGAAPLATAVRKHVQDEEDALKSMEDVFVRQPAWSVATEVKTYAVHLQTTARHALKAISIVNGTEDARSVALEGSRIKVAQEDEHAVFQMGQEAQALSIPFLDRIRKAVLILSKLKTQQLEKPLQDLNSLLKMVQKKKDMLAKSGGMLTLTLLQRVMELSNTEIRKACESIASLEAPAEEEDTLKAVNSRLSNLLKDALARLEVSQQHTADTAKRYEAAASISEKDIAMAAQLQAQEDERRAIKSVDSLRKQALETATRLEKSRMYVLISHAKDVCATVRAFSKDLHTLKSRVDDLHARITKHQQDIDFQLGMCEQARQRGVKIWMHKFEKERDALVANLLAALAATFGNDEVVIQQTEGRKTAVRKSLHAVMDLVLKEDQFNVIRHLYDRFYDVWEDFMAANLELLQAKLEVLYANVFQEVLAIDAKVRGAFQKGV